MTPEVESKERLKSSETLAILDAGAQYGKVIDRRIRNLGVHSEILPLDTPAKELKGRCRAVIISGGPQSVYDSDAPSYDPAIFGLDIPILGICYGMQLIAQEAGGRVERGRRREDGPCVISADPTSPLFEGLDTKQTVLMSHGDSVTELPVGFRAIADSNGIVAAIENPTKRLYGVQFHPEVDLTENGKVILRNFLFRIAEFSGDYTIENREEAAIAYIKETVGDNEVLVLVSGGVDSTVCALLLAKALGPDKVHALHIDNGFMRLNESVKVKEALEMVGLRPMIVDAQETFYNATIQMDGEWTPPLMQVVHPEIKRKIIGDTFIKVAQDAMREIAPDLSRMYLGQGTLRPDLIESASSLASTKAAVIKTHHNDTALVRKLRAQGRIVEPLRDYHKDEVRLLGESLGLPPEIVWRQPFPGPGLAIRIICAEEPYITQDFEKVYQALQKFTTPEVIATLLPVQTVGVQGDGRTYSFLAALSGKRDWDQLVRIAREIPKEIYQINRVVYLFGEPVKDLPREITTTRLTTDTVKQLQEADDIVNQVLLKYGLIRTISQVPVVLFPVHFGKRGKRSIGIRTFITNDFMTGVPAIPGKDIPEAVIDEVVLRILSEVHGISRIAYDLTSKPPGTTEWE